MKSAIQKQNRCFKVHDTEMKSAKFQINSSNTQTAQIICLITEHVWKTLLQRMYGHVAHICEFLGHYLTKPVQNWQFEYQVYRNTFHQISEEKVYSILAIRII